MKKMYSKVMLALALASVATVTRRPGGFAIRRQKMFDLLKPGDL